MFDEGSYINLSFLGDENCGFLRYRISILIMRKTDVVIDWCDLPRTNYLFENEVHVYIAKSNLPDIQIEQLARVLSNTEQERARRFLFDRHRNVFIISRGLLRMLLSRYTGCSPDQIDFIYGHRGKPFLNNKNQNPSIYFNLSHTKGLILYTFAACPWIGVDVEYVRTETSVDETAKRYFHPNENKLLALHTVEQRKFAFYKLWTCKEAYLKATGEGLAGLELVEILHMKGNRISIKRYDNAGNELLKWSICPFEPKHDYSGAIVIARENINFKFYNIEYESLMKHTGESFKKE